MNPSTSEWTSLRDKHMTERFHHYLEDYCTSISDIDKLTKEYRGKGFSDEVIITELVWPLFNFLYCGYTTKKVRETPIPSRPHSLMANVFQSHASLDFPDLNYCRLSKLLKCIVFAQDINKSTRLSEVLGENAKYILKDFLGKPIFTGSSEEGLAIYGNESMIRSDNFDRLSYRLNHDIDIMYESDKMVAYEIGSYTTKIEKSGVMNVLMRPGKKAGYVTLQKCIPKYIFCGLFSEDKLESKIHIMTKVVKLYPKPQEYEGQEVFSFPYLQTIAFLKECESWILPRDYSECRVACLEVSGKNPNRHGDLCEACGRASLKEIDRGKGKSPTKLWSDIIRIEGPSVFEMSIIENEPVQSNSRAPKNETESAEQLIYLSEKVLGIHRSSPREDKQQESSLPTVEPQLNDIFSSPGRKMICVDHVPAIKCAMWPSAATEFIVRERPSGWPSDDLVKQIVKKGCHVIPRGIKAPPNTKSKQIHESMFNFHHFMEWRLSFSVAEKILAASLNEVQVKCYMLLKVLHEKIKEEIKPSKDVEESYGFDPVYPDSYFLKTTFFWVCEKIPLSEWNDDNLGSCFIQVLDQLILFLENETLPNYFIPSSNIVPFHDINTKYTRPLCDTRSFAKSYWDYRSKSSESLFDSLQTIVWSSLWSVSEKRPPGSTPWELERIKRAMFVEEEEEVEEDYHWEIFHQKKQSGKEATDDVVTSDVYSAPIDDQLKSSCSKSSDVSDKREIDTDDLSKPVQWPCKLDKVLAQIFAAISKFIYTHGNTYGLGVNTARAAFYKEEAKKLLPAGCSLSDLEEYELSDSSDDSDYTYDSDESDDEFRLRLRLAAVLANRLLKTGQT